ncbi:hypothetical protein NDU88_006065 [Pleurodeles waltl]|uniref:Uncharacterized protein n=1 Tax=Pleurodeles waltl TaxID=8319 RepID=A0AAV7NQR5_PLEWA|nr:hypothetical protein NDU88_006065 [Pleurodeles waltl]
MGCGDPKQRKLPFERARESDRRVLMENVVGGMTDAPEGESPPDMTTITTKLQSGFWAIDARFKTPTARLGCMGEQLDCHKLHLGGAEELISSLEDNSGSVQKHLEKVEKILQTVAIKNKDSEARSQRNNLRILGRVEVTDSIT